VRPFAPITVERIRQALLAGAGRDGKSTRHDVLALRDRDAVMVPVLAYAGLRPQEISGRPDDREPVIPALDGSAMTENAFEMWRSRAWTAALKAAGPLSASV
jgi:hypothetical protein